MIQALNSSYILKKCFFFVIIILLIIFIYTNWHAYTSILRRKTKNIVRYNVKNFNKNKENTKLIQKEKNDLLKFLSKNIGKNLTKIKTIFLSEKHRFGNQFILFNKIIFFCEILGCKRIILNKKYYWFIKNKIINKKYKMIIEPDSLKYKDYPKIIDESFIFFHYSNIFKIDFKINLLKNEIIKNLPKLNIKIGINDLFIYIRSGDIFNNNHPCPFYSQPPLCFYSQIILNYKYKKLYLISENKNNPVINYLLMEFPNIIYNKNDIKLDMIFLINAYNIVGTKSTFLKCLIELNNNLKILYEYDLNFNDSFDKILNTFNFNQKYIIYKMNSSTNYKNEMKIWNNSLNQRNLMITEKCLNNFSIINKR